MLAKTISFKNKSQVLIIAGPTASGKSSLALDIADIYPATIINADSQQVYKELSIISARPDEGEMARAPHRLFGVMGAGEVCSAGRWLDMAKIEIETAIANGRIPLVVGGTGMYLKALTDGLSPIPEVSVQARQTARDLWRDAGSEEFIRRLAELDPKSAADIAPSDAQRLMRAMEVSLSTGRPFSGWKDEPRIKLLSHLNFATIQLLPDRDILYSAINSRFDEMVNQGALREVKNLLELGLDGDLPAMKALGVPELAAHIRGEISLDEALEKAKTASRNYAKRQLTWARHQMDGEVLSVAQYSESSRGEIFSFIDQFLLTENA